jgi:creatinine amidohydrolase
MSPWKLSDTNYGEVKQRKYEVAVLPFGATEPHNLHLPYSTDALQCSVVGEKICEEAHRRGAKVILLPTLPYGTQTNQAKFPFAMNLYPSTLGTIVSDLVESLVRTGIRKVVLLNGHGGNELKSVLRELHGRTPAQLFLCDWYTVCGDIYKEIFEQPDNHAGEMETSMALAHFPELVARNPDGTLKADEGRPAETRFDAVNRGWVTITRPWHLLTTNTGAGNPHAATAEKGHRLTAALVERLSQFLVELSAAEVDERFPY